MSYSDRHLFTSVVQTLDGATDLEIAFAPLNRVTIHKIGLMPVNNAAGGVTVTFERRRVATTDTTIEVVVIPAADHQGDVIYTEVISGFVFEVGDRLNLAISAEAATAPTAYALLEYSINDVDLDAGTSGVVIESA